MEKLRTGLNSFVTKMSHVISNAETRVEFDEESYNGIVFDNNILIPEELISRIFVYYMDPKSLLNCQLVCKRWNMIINDYVWRQKATIRTHRHFTSEEPYDWMDYFIIITKIEKNLLKNHSGAEGEIERNWRIERNGGDGWIIENSPIGAPCLPEDPEFGNSQHCFVTSWGTCQKLQTINLISNGFTANILDNLQPPIQVGEWYSCRNDCPALYNLTVRLTSSNDETLDTFNFSDVLSDERQNVWHKVEHTFENYGRGLRKILFAHGGRDRLFWAGHYGSKMARAMVKVKNP